MKKESKLKIIKKKVRRSTLFLLFIALITNSFAWFIYSNKVTNDITTGVKSWKITFDQEGSTLEDYVKFEIDDIYPGMDDYEQHINITNNGEMKAYIIYNIEAIKIFDETYTKDDYTEEELINLLANNYPFKMTFTENNTEIDIDETGYFGVTLVWPYESGDDEKDTYYGKKSYEFKQTSDDPQIQITVKIKASQTKD